MTKPQLAEDARVVAFEGAPQEAVWLDDATAEALMLAEPTGNVATGQASDLVGVVINGVEHLQAKLEEEAARRAEELLEAHQRVREAARTTAVTSTVEPKLPVDILGIYVFVPQPAGS